MNVRVVMSIALAAAFLLTVAGASLVMVKRGTNADDASVFIPDQGWEGTVIPAFNLVDQDGEPVSESVFEGQVTVLDFIFTNCPLQCPAMTSVLTGVSERTQGSSLRFLSMSIDPARDSPTALAEHASRFGVDLGRWTMVTEPLAEGDEPDDVARKMLRDGFGYLVRDNEDADPIALSDGSSMANIVHPGVYFLIGPDREILGTYHYNRLEQIEDLISRAEQAAMITAKSRR
jgi:cytochrome oxidase Cu insertion factor (SCO1/SenC/PrrC family)